MKSLHELGLEYNTDKATSHAYTKDFYPDLLEHRRHTPVVLVEAGILKGHSLRMWSAYFDHPESELFGVDNWDKALTADVGRAKAIWCDLSLQTCLDDLEQALPPSLDIVIDDASHIPILQQALWEKLWPKVSPGGVYVVEDLQVGFDDDYKGRFFRKDDLNQIDGWLSPILKDMCIGRDVRNIRRITMGRKIIALQKDCV